jgi:hypothetical protein
MGGKYVVHWGAEKGTLFDKLKGKRPLGKPRRRWENNIEMDRRDIWCDVHWIHIARDREC